MRKNDNKVIYRGFIIIEEDGYLSIYNDKNKQYMSRVESTWKSGLTSAKSKVDKVMALHFDER